MLHEISRKIINLNKYEETNICWNNSVLTVRGIKELHLLEFSYNLNSLEKGIDFKECTVSCSKTSPLPEHYLTDYVSRGVRNLELVDMVTNSAFWPHNKLLMQELTKITAYQWSPFNLLCENDGLLAAVNSVGNVEFYGAQRRAWYSIMDFSSLMKTHLDEHINKICKNPKKFTDIKETVYFLETASICWASNLNEDNSCYFVTAQKSGDILFWSIKYHLGYFETEFCGSIQHTNNIEIVQMLWITMEEHIFLLVCSNECGEIICYKCQMTEKQVTLLNIHYLWSYKDKMVTTYLHHHFEDDKLLLIFNKHRHLVIQMYDKNLKLLFQNVENVNDYKITSLTKYKDTFFLTTVNKKLYRIDYSIVDDTVQFSLEVIEFKDPGPSYELYGIAISTNSALFALAMINRKLLLKKQTVSIEIVLLSPDTGIDTEITNILNNPSKKLTHMWDVIELFRCKTMKTKKLPELDYGCLLNDDNDTYSMKVYLIILNLYHNLKKCITPGLQGWLPETSIEVIKEKILMLQAFTQIHNIYYANFKTNPCLSTFDYECFGCSKTYLDYYCKKYCKNLTDIVAADVLKTSDFRFKYLCQWCDESLIDFSCINKHVNMICSLTFTPIENDYLVCRSCNATATKELYSQNPTCIFCDLYLINRNFIT
ncbi:uncharacterized protein [Maniola hyperantus]|uniref:uncharacterized protein n=1 Tax=Aphantopus hyperantus TaxID=2795564 RepID=UPI001567D27F|nr:uncharacterized protein LOC117985380 [Maniola hyperantus]